MNSFLATMASSMGTDYRLRSDMNLVRISSNLKRILGPKAKYLSEEDIEQIKDIWAVIKSKEMIQLLIKMTFEKQNSITSTLTKDLIEIENFSDMKQLESLSSKYFLTKKYLLETYPDFVKSLMAITMRSIRIRLKLGEILSRGFVKNNTEWFLIKFILYQLSNVSVAEFFGYENHNIKTVDITDANSAFQLSSDVKVVDETFLEKKGRQIKKCILEILFNIEVQNDMFIAQSNAADVDVIGALPKYTWTGRRIVRDKSDEEEDVFKMVNSGLTNDDVDLFETVKNSAF